jgi:Xaa-Pro aminopeptidase
VNTRDPQALIEKLKDLPPERIAEVEDFVDFLRLREDEARDAAAARLGTAMAKLAALDFPPMSEEEVQAEIDAARRERRERLGADRR